MQILLLSIAGLTLKGLITRLTIDEHFSTDNPHRGARSKDIQERGLSSTRNTHKRRQDSRFDPSVNMVKNPAILLSNLDIEADILPLEDCGLAFNHGKAI